MLFSQLNKCKLVFLLIGMNVMERVFGASSFHYSLDHGIKSIIASLYTSTTWEKSILSSIYAFHYKKWRAKLLKHSEMQPFH